MRRPSSLTTGVIRRHCRLQDRIQAMEDLHGPDSRQAETAVKALISFEEEMGEGLAVLLASCPAPQVRLRVSGSEAIFQEAE